jgi:hypothetical protein
MPRVKRWSPISHDFNRDPEVITMRQRFGDWTALAWQEILHEGDRNEGVVKGNIEQIAFRLALISLQKYHKPAADCAQNMLKYVTECGWISVELDHIQITNHLKYHRTREPNKFPSEPDRTRPNQTRPKEKIIHAISDLKWPAPELLIKKYNDETPPALPAVEKITPARLKKAREYLKIFPEEQFWTDAFKEIGKSQFLQGLRNGNGHNSFIANFDWLLTKGKDGTENVVKVFEAKYGN